MSSYDFIPTSQSIPPTSPMPSGLFDNMPATQATPHVIPRTLAKPSSFFDNVPPNIASLRNEIFLLRIPLQMPRARWNETWPYVDNIWVQNKKIVKDGLTTIYYNCRQHSNKTWAPKAKSSALHPSLHRQKMSKEALGCGMKFKAVMSSTLVNATLTGECKVHCHDLESLDKQKKNSGIMTLAANQISQGYNVAAVTANITGKNRPQDRAMLKNLGGHWFNLQDAHNAAAAYKSVNPDPRRVETGNIWTDQVSSALTWLSEQTDEGEGRWKARQISTLRDTDGETSQGLVFGHRLRLQLLARHGYLTLMDATHNTNEMKWLLYTLMVRQKHGKWIPGAHILTAKADSNIVQKGLEQVSIVLSYRFLIINHDSRLKLGVRTLGIFDTSSQMTPLVSNVLLQLLFLVHQVLSADKQ